MDATHSPELKSWIESANVEGCDFPIQNLPFGVFRRRASRESPRGGVAIGDQILDVMALGLRTGSTLDSIAAMARPARQKLRREISRLLSEKSERKKVLKHLVPMNEAEHYVPVSIGDYTDFYCSSFHATNIGRMFRPDNPLLPNFKWIPIGYHGRASSIVISGSEIRRPHGQLKEPTSPEPTFGPSKRLDYEAELGFIVGTGNTRGKPISIRKALDHLFGVVLLNDWSARDIQSWEYQPLGPFLSKSFATTISPWIVTMEALEPFRVPAFHRPSGDPAPLPHLLDRTDQKQGMYSIEVQMELRSASMRAVGLPAMVLSRANYSTSYWTPAQMVTHHTSNGCNLRTGDLLGTGTISGPSEPACGAIEVVQCDRQPDQAGSMMELSHAGKHPRQLPTGESRRFIEDGDEMIERARCVRSGFVSIGFGEATGRVQGESGRKRGAPSENGHKVAERL